MLLLLQTDLLSLSKEHEAHVNQSKPYIQMQQLLRRKNQQLAEVRAQLRKCVWAGVGEASAGKRPREVVTFPLTTRMQVRA